MTTLIPADAGYIPSSQAGFLGTSHYLISVQARGHRLSAPLTNTPARQS
ncbi:hypothetical protein PspLS_00370 [Pyricularia sp. CBS 133598]|nr:hypothetical protein PspLS_00370 [Pyricularia sp. CBS 133598]